MTVAQAMATLDGFRARADRTQRELLDGYLDGRLERWPGQFRHEMDAMAERALRAACKLERRRRSRKGGRT